MAVLTDINGKFQDELFLKEEYVIIDFFELNV